MKEEIGPHGSKRSAVRTPRRGKVLAASAAAVVLAALLPGGAAVGTECPGVRPGAVLIVPLTPPVDPRPYPTFGFMFSGSDGHVYASTAGHVALGLESGERMWEAGTGIVGFDADGRRIGEFSYAINTRTETRPGLPPGADLALIRVDDAVEVDPSVCVFGGPHGLDDRIIDPPELVHHRWFGATPVGGRVGYPLPDGPWLVGDRSGVSVGMPSEHVVSVIGHAAPGDSGAPVLSEDGLAVGLIAAPPATIEQASMGGSFIVSRLGPAVSRAEEALGITLSLVTA